MRGLTQVCDRPLSSRRYTVTTCNTFGRRPTRRSCLPYRSVHNNLTNHSGLDLSFVLAMIIWALAIGSSDVARSSLGAHCADNANSPRSVIETGSSDTRSRFERPWSPPQPGCIESAVIRSASIHTGHRRLHLTCLDWSSVLCRKIAHSSVRIAFVLLASRGIWMFGSKLRMRKLVTNTSALWNARRSIFKATNWLNDTTANVEGTSSQGIQAC
jgi:hypothetical protein